MRKLKIHWKFWVVTWNGNGFGESFLSRKCCMWMQFPPKNWNCQMFILNSLWPCTVSSARFETEKAHETQMLISCEFSRALCVPKGPLSLHWNVRIGTLALQPNVPQLRFSDLRLVLKLWGPHARIQVSVWRGRNSFNANFFNHRETDAPRKNVKQTRAFSFWKC